MNKERRKRLSVIAEQVSALIDKAREIRDEEKMAFNNMPEGHQQAVWGQEMAENVTFLEAAVGGLEKAKDWLEEVKIE